MTEILEQYKYYAYAFLSAAPELQQVELTYVTSESGESTVTFTREEADAYVGGDISAQAKTLAGRRMISRSNKYSRPGRTNSTMASEQSVPLPRK